MATQSLDEHVWLSIALGLIMYVVDYYLTQYEVYLFHNYAKQFFVFNGRYEGSNILKRVRQNKWMPSSSFFAALALTGIGIYAGWYALVVQLILPEVFSFLMGGLILHRVARSLIHFRYISLFKFAREEGEIEGMVEYSKRVTFTLPYMEMYGFTVLFLLLFFFYGGWFLPGGILTCFIAARQHRDWVLIKT